MFKDDLLKYITDNRMVKLDYNNKIIINASNQ